MNITINVLEVASDLANLDLQEIWSELYPTQSYMIEEDGTTRYTEEAQDIFNDYYDFYFTLLTNASLELNDKD
jgi:hypothetical protein